MRQTALVAGSGPNGLAAAIRLAQAGIDVTVREAAAEPGGATRSGELTLPGFLHDLGSAVHPMAVSSPFFSTLPLQRHGLEWIWPKAELAHPFDDGTAVTLERDISATAIQLGEDANAYQSLFEPLITEWPVLKGELLRPLGLPRHPLLLAQFGLNAMQPASWLVRRFKGHRAKAVFAGMAAHSTLPLDALISSSFGLVLGTSAHAVGWPVARGGSQSIWKALVAVLESLGGRVITNSPVTDLQRETDLVLCDLTPKQFVAMAGGRLPTRYRRSLARFRYGPGIYKMDWALREPIPWKAKDCYRSATVHLGASYEEILASEAAVNRGKLAQRPFVLLTQPSLFDTSRAPTNQHTAWAYCHVPNGFPGAAAEQIENQIERFAPGFRECVLARRGQSAVQMQSWNSNLVGGDINGGSVDWRQFFFRPTFTRYKTPLPSVFLCSSSTPPGGSVHGMCGYWAAETALRRLHRPGASAHYG